MSERQPEAIRRPMTPAERQRKWRENKKAQLGITEFNRLENDRIAKIYHNNKNKPKTLLQKPEKPTKKTQAAVDPIPYIKELKPAEVKPAKTNLIDTDYIECDDMINLLYDNKMKSIDDKTSKAPAIKKSTLETYINNLKILHKKMKIVGKFDCDNLDFLKDYKSVIEFIMGHKWSLATRKAYFTALSSILKELKGFGESANAYLQMLMKLGKEQTAEIDNNKPTEKQAENFIEWDILKDLYKNIKNTHDKLIVGLYTIIPPRRNKDYRLMKISKGDTPPADKNFNYLDINTAEYKFIFNTHKTEYKYDGPQIFKVPSELKKILKKFIEFYDLKDGDLLFSTTDWEPLTQSAFSTEVLKIFTKYTGKNITINSLRHSIISDLYKNNPTNKEKKKLAKAMGHSVEMQSTYNHKI